MKVRLIYRMLIKDIFHLFKASTYSLCPIRYALKNTVTETQAKFEMRFQVVLCLWQLLWLSLLTLNKPQQCLIQDSVYYMITSHFKHN